MASLNVNRTAAAIRVIEAASLPTEDARNMKAIDELQKLRWDRKDSVDQGGFRWCSVEHDLPEGKLLVVSKG